MIPLGRGGTDTISDVEALGHELVVYEYEIRTLLRGTTSFTSSTRRHPTRSDSPPLVNQALGGPAQLRAYTHPVRNEHHDSRRCSYDTRRGRTIVLRFTNQWDIQLVMEINSDSNDHFIHVVGMDGLPRQGGWQHFEYMALTPLCPKRRDDDIPVYEYLVAGYGHGGSETHSV
jgi:hypothetical protein